MFCTNLLHSLIMSLIVSSYSTNTLHLQFCCMISVFALMLWCCFVLQLEEIQFPFLCHEQVFLCEISLVCRLQYQYCCFSNLLLFFLFLLFMSS